jgi:hypothetical protein
MSPRSCTSQTEVIYDQKPISLLPFVTNVKSFNVSDIKSVNLQTFVTIVKSFKVHIPGVFI